MLAILKRAPDTDDPVAAEDLVALSTPTVTSAAFVPSMFATEILLIFTNLFDATVIKAVVVVVPNSKPWDSPIIEDTDTIFGAAIIYSFYPKTIAIAIAFPVVARPTPLACTSPVPFGTKFILIFESPPVAEILGLLPVAALVISNWFTADAVV